MERSLPFPAVDDAGAGLRVGGIAEEVRCGAGAHVVAEYARPGLPLPVRFPSPLVTFSCINKFAFTDLRGYPSEICKSEISDASLGCRLPGGVHSSRC